MEMHSALALIRFGLGRRADETPPADPQTWLTEQLSGPGAAYADGLPGVSEALDAMRDRALMRKLAGAKLDPKDDPVAIMVHQEAIAASTRWITAEDSFRERLVLFWANHFTVSRRQGGCAPLIGPFVREAIAANLQGNFATMLLAVMRHPAMLIYLNNDASCGPDSLVGQRLDKGLNENLGRECLELHTVSPAAGYSQADVTAMASILTGWSVKRLDPGAGFFFRRGAHEPGSKILMGREFPEGEQGGIEALDFLGHHPATATHIATKLARHFVSDDPSPAVVQRLAARFMETGGSLPEVTRTLIESPEAWPAGRQGLVKLRTPIDFVCATLRAVDAPPEKLAILPGAMNLLGQPLWTAPSPKGWSDRASDWSDPALLLRRVEFAYQVSAFAGDQDIAALTDVALGPYITAPVRAAVANAGSRREAVALLFSAPEFWRR